MPHSRARRTRFDVLALLAALALVAGSCRSQSATIETDGAAPAIVAVPADPAARSAVATSSDSETPSVAEIAARRARVLEKIGPDGLLAVRAGEESESSVSGFRPDPDFYYLTGLVEPGAVVVIDPGRGVDGASEILFLEPKNPRRETWDGPRLAPGPEAARLTGIAKTLPVGDLDGLWGDLLRDKKTVYINARTPRGEPATGDLRRIAEASAIAPTAAKGPAAAPADASPVAIKRPSTVTAESRQAKSPAEIACLRRAIDATCDAIEAAAATARPGLPEYRLQALIEFTFRDRGCERPAFASIVGSGPNSCVLHYRANERVMQEGDLVVMDVGGEYRGYAADVTRTIPVSGRFTPEQRAIYEIVLRAQAAGIAKVAPGNSMRDVHLAAAAVIRDAGHAKAFFHGTSHWVGLDVHDVGSENVLRPGMVLTVEPGIYLLDKALGVRIEDTVLVTETGCEVLSVAAPKDPDEIEALVLSRAR